MPYDFAGLTVIFDLDGTLVDTAPDLVRALNATLAEDGFPPVPISDVREMVGRGARALLHRAYARSGTARPEPILTARVKRFIDVYAQDIAAQSRAFPGAIEAVDRARAAGAACVIATNKPQALTELLLKALKIETRFARIIGADAAPRKKPDASHLLAAAGSAEALARSVMVGDSSTDVAAARAAGVPVIVFSQGYTETPAEKLGGDRLIGSFDDLDDALAALFKVRVG